MAGNLILPVDCKFSLFYYYDDFEASGKLSWQPKTVSKWSITPDNGKNSYCYNPEGGWGLEYSLLQGVTVEEFKLSVNVRSTAESNQDIGIIFGYQNSANYFYLWHAMDGPSVLTKTRDGTNYDLMNLNLISDMDYHNLVVSYTGGTVVICMDGVEKGRIVFDNLPAGQVGLCSGGGSKVYFDDFSLTLLSSGYTKVSEESVPSDGSAITVQPNPFNPSARISYYLAQKAQVNLVLYNLHGKVVRNLMSGMVSAGRHAVQVDANGLASGIYICELKSKATAKRLKLVLMR